MPGSNPTTKDSSLARLLTRTGRQTVPRVAWPLLALHVGLLLVYDLGRAPWLTLSLTCAAFGAFFWAVARHERVATPATILSIAALLRLVLLPLPPTLSDDLLRYVWDGRVAVAGFDPYALVPDAPELESLRDARWQRMPHRDVQTVYPPVALGVFSIASLTPWPGIAIKLLLVIADLFGCWLLIRLASAHGLPRGRAAWYAWNPLVVMEVAGMGHVDALVAAASIAALLLITRRRAAGAGAAAAIGVLSKLSPLIALPMWARQSRRPVRFSIAAGVLITVVTAPFLVKLGGPPPGLVTYGVRWEYNGPLYEPLWRALDAVDAATHVKASLDQVKQWTGWHERLNQLYPLVYPQFLAKLALALLFGIAVLRSLRDPHPVLGTGRLFGALLLCSATLYPWYLLWILPWAALTRHPAWLALAALIQLSYLPQLTHLTLMPFLYTLIWLPFAVLLWRFRWSTD